MSKKKILVLSHTSELVGGAERSIIEVFDILHKKYGIEPEFILREPLGTMVNALKKRGWKYYSLPYGFWSESKMPTNPEEKYKRSLMNAKAVIEVEGIIKHSNPDAVLTNSVVCPWAAVAANFLNVPHIWFVREYGDLDHGRVFELGREATFQDVGNSSELVIANSTSLASHVAQFVPVSKITTLYHPFNINKLLRAADADYTNPFKLPKSLKTVIIAGSITATKGHLEAVEAIGKLNTDDYSAELAIVGHKGSVEYMNAIAKIISKYDIADKVHFLGQVKNDQVLALIKSADVGITGSKKEAFGRLTFEYIALGKPVVGTNSGATPEMVHDGNNGYLYKYKDETSLYKALLRYAKKPNLIKEHGDASVQIAQKMLKGPNNIDALAKKILRVPGSAVDKQDSMPLHFSRQWLLWLIESEDYIQAMRNESLKRVAKKAIKTRLDRANRRVKSFARRVLHK